MSSNSGGMGPPAPLSLTLSRRAGPRKTAGDQGVQKTNDDAQATKLSCASVGYFQDDILPMLAKCPVSRKPPIINRGTWARHAVLRQILVDFVTACVQQHPQQHTVQDASAAKASSQQQGQRQHQLHEQASGRQAAVCLPVSAQQNQQATQQGASSTPATQVAKAAVRPASACVCQVVALGAGTDSTWFNLQQQAWPHLKVVHYIEMDFPEVVSKKARTILSTYKLLHLLPDSTVASPNPAAGGQHTKHSAKADGSHSVPTGWTKPAAATEQPTTSAISGLLMESTSKAAFTQPQATTAEAELPQCLQFEPSQAPASQGQSAATTAECTQHLRSVAGATASSLADSANSSSRRMHAAVPPAAVVRHAQELSGPCYSLVGADLRDKQQYDAALMRAGFDDRLPTLYLCECVLVYLEPSEAEAVLTWAAQRAAAAGSVAAVAIYEQTRPHDAFGAIMLSNLQARNCPLRSLLAVPTPAAQEQRLLATGWSAAAAADMATVYYGSTSSSGGRIASQLAVTGTQQSPVLPQQHAWATGTCTHAAHTSIQQSPIPEAGLCASSGWLRPHWQQERQRIERLELVDELEEWLLLQEHYCLVLGVSEEQHEVKSLSRALQLQQLHASKEVAFNQCKGPSTAANEQ